MFRTTEIKKEARTEWWYQGNTIGLMTQQKMTMRMRVTKTVNASTVGMLLLPPFLICWQTRREITVAMRAKVKKESPLVVGQYMKLRRRLIFTLRDILVKQLFHCGVGLWRVLSLRMTKFYTISETQQEGVAMPQLKDPASENRTMTNMKMMKPKLLIQKLQTHYHITTFQLSHKRTGSTSLASEMSELTKFLLRQFWIVQRLIFQKLIMSCLPRNPIQ